MLPHLIAFSQPYCLFYIPPTNSNTTQGSTTSSQLTGMSFIRDLLSLALLLPAAAAPHNVAHSASTVPLFPTVTLISTSTAVRSVVSWPSKPYHKNVPSFAATFSTAIPLRPIDTSKGKPTVGFEGPELINSLLPHPMDTSRDQSTSQTVAACEAISTVTVTLSQPTDNSRGSAANASNTEKNYLSKITASSLSTVVLSQPLDTSRGQPPSFEEKPTVVDPPDEAYKTNQLDDSSNDSVSDPVAWANTNGKRSITSDPLNTSRRSYRNYFFAHALPQAPMPPNAPPQIVRDEDEDAISKGEVDENKCVRCGKNHGDIICIGRTHYGYCDEVCAEPRRLYDGLKCVDGRIFADRV